MEHPDVQKYDMPSVASTDDRVTLSGKYFRLGANKWYLKGFSYGPFVSNREGEPYPERDRWLSDLLHMQQLGANCLRMYIPPARHLLDDLLQNNLRVLIGIPWEKHRCFFEDEDAQRRAIDKVTQTARNLGDHRAVFAFSVGNEIPADIVRFYGQKRVAGFINQLVDAAKQQAPECLVTYANFPRTEFLVPTACDFDCFNVFVHDIEQFRQYLDRLQLLSGNRPLILGEHGVDTLSEGDVEQATYLTGQLRSLFRQGLAGSFVFAYTDDWHTGGHQIDDWAFGITEADRSEKVAALSVRKTWAQAPFFHATPLPRVSVVIACYNGGSTLRECLHSLMRLDYPDYEVVLVDDGSTDETSLIADEFPQVIVQRLEENVGLSVARNVGAKVATGEIVAYTDADCMADEDWLRHLIPSMLEQGVEAIGGLNIPPPCDSWIAKCVAVSPGNPSHVMLNDRQAEHVPGCNMALRRKTLLGIGGFDARFRQAGDDIDICWRLLDANIPIGFTPAAMVWHKRRATVSAYFKQQMGYGRSEAMVHFKHPRRCGLFGRSRWKGVIYADVDLRLIPDMIYHGRFGSGLFQTIYRHNNYGAWAVLMSLEWHLLALFALLLAMWLYAPLAGVAVAMWSATLALTIRSAWQAVLPSQAPWWCRPLVALLHIGQPILRGWCRTTHLLRHRRLPSQFRTISAFPWRDWTFSKQRDMYWDSRQGVGREQLLDAIINEALRSGWSGDHDNAWTNWDLKLVGDRWHDITFRTATEELGHRHRFTRARYGLRCTGFSQVAALTSIAWTLTALASWQTWGIAVGLIAGAAILASSFFSGRRCLRAATALLQRAARVAGLDSASCDRIPIQAVKTSERWLPEAPLVPTGQAND